MTVDARPLSMPNLLMDSDVPVNNVTPAGLTLLPGAHGLWDYAGSEAIVRFTVNMDGMVAYDASLEGILSGRGTNTVTVHGVTVTIDTRALSIPVLLVDTSVGVSNTVPLTFTGLSGTIPVWDYAGSGTIIHFTLNADGTVDYDAALDGILSGRGTSTLLVRGLP
jgi:hypothetical protein